MKRRDKLQIITLILAVAGVMLNNEQIIWCFPIWMVSNTISAVLHIKTSLYWMAIRDGLFMALGVWGWLSWGGWPS